MDITEVRVFPVEEERLKAYVTITFDDCFVVRDLKIINGNTGLFVAMPSKKRKDGTYKDLAHPINNDFRSKLEKFVLEAYQREMRTPGNETEPLQVDSSKQTEQETETRSPTENPTPDANPAD